ncbi:MAG: hypothetical protein ACI9FD_002379, partial [Gammaproteobacteria bacterium]
DKLIFLDVGTEWCGACNQMQHETYSDEIIQKRLDEDFISIHVDAEAEPDLGERYGFWGWPALIFLKPNGEHVAFFRGFRPTDTFASILDDLNTAYRNGTLEAMAVDVDLVSTPSDSDLGAIVELADAMIDRFYDQENHNWGGSRMADQFLMQQAWWRGGDWHNRAMMASENILKLMDPVWGGVWFGSRQADMGGGFIHEKRTEHQAAALSIFARAYQATGDKKWRLAMDSILSYLNNFMGTDQAAYFTSQEQHVYLANGSITPEDYFAKDNLQRRKLGLPDIDTALYTDINSKLVIAFSVAYEATGDKRFIDRAAELMTFIQSNGAFQPGAYGQILQAGDQTNRNRPIIENDNRILYLRTLAFAGLASLSVFEITQDIKWFDEAQLIAQRMQSDLLDDVSGGLLGSNRRSVGPDGQVLRDQPLIDVGAAGEFLNKLAAYSYGQLEQEREIDAKQYIQLAGNTLRAVARPERLRVQGNFIGHYVLALHQHQDEFIQINIVCRQLNSDACNELSHTVRTELPHPRRVLKVQEPGYYPDRGEAVLFICNSSACSTPMPGDSDGLIEQADAYFKILSKNG